MITAKSCTPAGSGATPAPAWSSTPASTPQPHRLDPDRASRSFSRSTAATRPSCCGRKSTPTVRSSSSPPASGSAIPASTASRACATVGPESGTCVRSRRGSTSTTIPTAPCAVTTSSSGGACGCCTCTTTSPKWRRSAGQRLQPWPKLLDPDPFLLGRIALPNRDRAVVQGVEVDRDAVRRADLVLAAVAPADVAAGLVVLHPELTAQRGDDVLRGADELFLLGQRDDGHL